MPNQGIIDYIKQCREKNIAEDVIKGELIKAGWGDGDVNEAFDSFLAPILKKTNNPPKTKMSFRERFLLWYAPFLSIGIFLIIAVFKSFPFGSIINGMAGEGLGGPVENSMQWARLILSLWMIMFFVAGIIQSIKTKSFAKRYFIAAIFYFLIILFLSGREVLVSPTDYTY